MTKTYDESICNNDNTQPEGSILWTCCKFLLVAYGVTFIIGKIPVQTPISAGPALEPNLSEAPGDLRVELVSHTVINIELVRLRPRDTRYVPNSPSQMFFKKDIVKNFAIFTEKHLCLILFLIWFKFIKKRLLYRCFPANITKFWRKAFFITHLRWLLLHIVQNVLGRCLEVISALGKSVC